MNHATISFVILSLFSCNNANHKSNDKKEASIITAKTDASKIISHVKRMEDNDYSIYIMDSSKFIIPDIFLISETDYHDAKKYPFFRDAGSNCNLFFVPYTDGSITTAILCRDFDIPIPYKELLAGEGLDFNSTSPIKVSKIQSVNGIDINSRKADFIRLYGSPDSISTKNDIEVFYWNLQMRESDSTIYDFRKLQPILLYGLHFGIELHVKQNAMVALIYNYEVP
ncbi:MAG: hypothetical protein U0X41_02785 [Chitinophagales bacterium]